MMIIDQFFLFNCISLVFSILSCVYVSLNGTDGSSCLLVEGQYSLGFHNFFCHYQMITTVTNLIDC